MKEKEISQEKQQNVSDFTLISKTFLNNEERLTNLKKRAKKRERNNINSVSSNNSSNADISRCYNKLGI